MSGFLAGKGFSLERYSYNWSGIKKYYVKKIKNVIVPTFAFLLICCVIAWSEWTKINYKNLLLKIFTFSYNGSPGISGPGATWYVFTLIPLYALTPFICLLMNKLKAKPRFLLLTFFLFLILGFCYRFIANKNGLDWYNYIYTPFYANFDLFICGICMSFLLADKNVMNLKNQPRKKTRWISLTCLLGFIAFNSYTYNAFYFYQIVYPTIYIVLMSINLFLFDFQFNEHNDSKLSNVLTKFSNITFEFYLFHSLVLAKIICWFNESNSVILYFKVLVVSFVLTLIFSIMFNRAFRKN